MSDLISRQAAIDALQKEINKGIPPFDDVMGSIRCGVRLARNIIEDLPSAQQWIPCSERLPEDYTDVLAWFEYFRYGDYNCLYQTHGIGSYSTEYDSWMINHETGWHKLRVIAWMPLPEPYREERTEE